MAALVYIGNLGPQTSSDDIREAFSAAGHAPRAVKLVRDPVTGRRRGFGYVELEDEHAAAAAMESLNGASVAGRRLSVEPATSHQRSRFIGERWESADSSER